MPWFIALMQRDFGLKLDNGLISGFPDFTPTLGHGDIHILCDRRFMYQTRAKIASVTWSVWHSHNRWTRHNAKSNPSVLGAWCKPQEGVKDPLTAEALGLRNGAIFAKIKGFLDVIMEIDCLCGAPLELSP